MDDDDWATTDFTAIFKYLNAKRRLPAAHLLRHLQDSDELSNVDRTTVESTVRTLEDDEAEIETAIRDAGMLLSFFQVQLEEVQAKLDDYRALVAPIRHVPFEVMQEIFLYTEAAERIADPEDDWHPAPNRPPIVAQVNRQWRRVALSTPKLWSRCMMVFGVHTSYQIKTLNLRISRASPLPVSLTIHTCTEEMPLRYEDLYTHLDDQPYYDSDDDYPLYPSFGSHGIDYEAEELIAESKKGAERLAESVIARNVDRLGSITVLEYSSALEHLFETVQKIFAPLAPASLPRLKAVTLPQEVWSHNPNSLFELAPNLERLWINSPDSTTARHSFGQQSNIPWTTLAAFRGPLPDSDLQTLFNTSTARLVLAEIAVTSFPPRITGGRISTPTPTPFQHLTSLALQAPDVSESRTLLPPLPALRHLIFHSDYSKYPTPAILGPPPAGWERQALSLVNAWGSQLEYLGLEFSTTTVNEIQPDALDDIISATPNLEALALPIHWSAHLERVVSRLSQLVHVELASCPQGVSTTTIEETTWSAEAFAKLDTLTFLASSDPNDHAATTAMENAKKVVKENGLKVAISCHRLCHGTRFSSPYFIQKGGVFAQSLLDEDELQRGIRMSTYYY